MLRRRFVVLSVGLGFSMAVLASGFFFRTTEAEKSPNAFSRKALPADSARQTSVSLKPMLIWNKDEEAVSYEIELFAEPSQSTPFFSAKRIYVNGFNADLSSYSDLTWFFWRVRGLDIEGEPLGAFSKLTKVDIDRQNDSAPKPVPTSIFNRSAGSTLLYPVYAWIPVAGAAQYEVEILEAPPENPNGITPSVHRIDSAVAVGFDHYDEKPRQSSHPLWWRVRGLDSGGNPVGVYSDAGEFSVNPDNPMEVAAFGDSITHGGGGVSHSPADWKYSYLNYLNFPVINLGRSSDTSQTMVERFERDVLPFRPQYLLIMGGTNSLRAGVRAESVIEDMGALKEKCLASKIRPIFLTLPPINPDNIQRVFNESTVSDWQDQLQLVNEYIRTQDHIDVALEMAAADGTLPTQLGIDGLHLGIKGKRKIAAAVNENWPRIVSQAVDLKTANLDSQ